MTSHATPEMWIGANKPYHLTGEIQIVPYIQRLPPQDKLLLTATLNHFQHIAELIPSSIHTLAVGSSADLTSQTYRDIDLVVCLGKLEIRAMFPLWVEGNIPSDSIFGLKARRLRLTSAPITEDPYEQRKLMAIPQNALVQEARNLDITFVSAHAGTFADILEFHRSNNLAFCNLTFFKPAA